MALVIGSSTAAHAKWHRAMEAYFARQPAEAQRILGELFAEDIAFKPPTYHKTRRSKPFAIKALEGVALAFEDFAYVREWVSPSHWALEFKCKVDGMEVQGVDLVTLDAKGEKIVEFAVAARPPNAMQALLKRQNEFMKDFLAAEAAKSRAKM